jgi:hypothetical protein
MRGWNLRAALAGRARGSPGRADGAEGGLGDDHREAGAPHEGNERPGCWQEMGTLAVCRSRVDLAFVGTPVFQAAEAGDGNARGSPQSCVSFDPASDITLGRSSK